MTYEERYNEMYLFIHSIAYDSVELSHDKIREQRDWYVKCARKLLQEFNEDFKKNQTEFNDNF